METTQWSVPGSVAVTVRTSWCSPSSLCHRAGVSESSDMEDEPQDHCTRYINVACVISFHTIIWLTATRHREDCEIEV